MVLKSGCRRGCDPAAEAKKVFIRGGKGPLRHATLALFFAISRVFFREICVFAEPLEICLVLEPLIQAIKYRFADAPALPSAE